MSMTDAAAGVCAACKYDPDCIYKTISTGVILQCEQFELGFREETAAPTQTPVRPGRKAIANGHLGLCVNCEHRDTCIYPKPEGGVWRCEEYL
jgi:hypothetical protein